MKKCLEVLARSDALCIARWCLLICLTTIAQAHASTASVGQNGATPTPSFLLAWQMQRTLFTNRDGLPSHINAIAEDEDGYLWLGGTTGLYRFDGVRFKPMFEHQLPAGVITEVFLARDGDLWVGDLHGHITRIHDNQPQEMDSGLGKGAIMSMVQMPDSTLWVGQSSGNPAWFNGKSWVHAKAADGIDVKSINNVQSGADGSLWIFSSTSAYRLRPGSRRFEQYSANAGFQAMANLPDSAVYPGDSLFASAVMDKEGAWWVPLDGRLERLHVVGGKNGKQLVVETVKANDGEADIREVTAAFVDKHGNVWISTPGDLEQFRTTRFEQLVLPRAMIGVSMATGNDGALWVASGSNAPTMRVGDTTSTYPLTSYNSPCLAKESDGGIWFAGDQGIQHVEDGRISSIPMPPWPEKTNHDMRPGAHCWDLQIASDHSVWISLHETGVFVWKNNAWSNIQSAPAMSIAIDGARTWMAFLSGALISIEGKKSETYAGQNGPDLGSLTKVYSGSAGLWVAGDEGVAVRVGNRFHRIRGVNGEQFANANDVVQLKNDDLWITSPQGIYRISAGEIRSALLSPAYAVRFSRFDQADGVENAQAMVTDGSRRLWVAMERGVASIDPLHIPAAPPPPRVSIESLNEQDVDNPDRSARALEKGTRNVSIIYSAATLPVPARYQFRFRMLGLDNDWETAGDRREARYANLGPGPYTFQVEASNVDGAWAEKPTALAFSILPEFYQTWWFKLLCIALALAGLWLLYLMRIRRIYAQLDARTRERESMARDFHDTILQNFQSLLLHVQLAVQSIPEGGARQKLDKALSVTEDALNEGRDKIGELRSLAEPLEDLAADIAHLADRLGEVYPTTFSMHVEGEPRSLVASAASDVHAMVGELVTNAFRHSQASAMHVELHYGRRELNITVIDDGRGTELSKQRPEKSGHWGLQGIRERARRVGGRFTIGTAPSGKGTRANLKIPARYVYASRRWFRR